MSREFLKASYYIVLLSSILDLLWFRNASKFGSECIKLKYGKSQTTTNQTANRQQFLNGEHRESDITTIYELNYDVSSVAGT